MFRSPQPHSLGGSGDTTLIAGASMGDVSSQISGGSTHYGIPGIPPHQEELEVAPGQALIRKLINLDLVDEYW